MEALNLIEKYGNDYLVIDFNNIFLTENISDEMMIYLSDKQLRDAISLAEKQITETFKITSYKRNKSLSRYSGGEKSLICCSIISSIIKTKSISSINILFVNILESLSKNNLDIIQEKIRQHNIENRINYYKLQENDLIPIVCN